MVDNSNIIISGFIAIITVFVIITGVIYPTSSPTISETGLLNNTTAYVFVHTPLIKMNSVGNASLASCGLGNFTITDTSIAVAGGSQKCVSGLSYNMNFDYQKDPYIVGINFAFVIVIAIALMFVIIYKKFK